MIIVTGSNGFIGRHVVRALKEDEHDVLEVDIDSGKDLFELERSDFKSADAVIHLAAYSLIKSREDPAESFRVNVGGLLHIMDHCVKTDTKLVLASASSIYGNPKWIPVTEKHPHDPVTIYGVTKLSMEKLAHVYHATKGLKYIVFRFTNVYGPGQINGIVPTAIKNISNRSLVYLTGTGTQTRDFVFVKDVVHFLIRGLEIDKTGTYNLGSGNQTSMVEVVNYVGDLIGIEPRISYTKGLKDDRNQFKASMSKLRSVFKESTTTLLGNGLIETIGGK